MTKRYTSSAVFFTDWGAGSTAQTVIVEDEAVKQTGLVDRYGTPICSYNEKQPAGFIRLRERTQS